MITRCDVRVLREQNVDLREQIEFLRDELRRNDAIITTMTQRIPELEAPSQELPKSAPTEGTEQPGRVEPQRPLEGAQESVERPWWRSVFGV
jgi:hypothetical protein